MKKINYFFLFILCVFSFSLRIDAQTKPAAVKNGDVRITKALNQINTKYELGKDGMYKVT